MGSYIHHHFLGTVTQLLIQNETQRDRFNIIFKIDRFSRRVCLFASADKLSLQALIAPNFVSVAIITFGIEKPTFLLDLFFSSQNIFSELFVCKIV